MVSQLKYDLKYNKAAYTAALVTGSWAASKKLGRGSDELGRGSNELAPEFWKWNRKQKRKQKWKQRQKR